MFFVGLIVSEPFLLVFETGGPPGAALIFLTLKVIMKNTNIFIKRLSVERCIFKTLTQLQIKLKRNNLKTMPTRLLTIFNKSLSI